MLSPEHLILGKGESYMRQLEYLVTNEEGLHAKPASFLVKTAQEYQSEIYLYRGDSRADLKNLFETMGLCVKKDSLVRIEIYGEDEDKAMDRIESLLSEL